MALESGFIEIPAFDWHLWIERWDKMLDRYLPGRAESLSVVVETVRQACGDISKVVDLGCGTGNLTELLLEAFPDAHVYGIDLDPTLLPLARKRTERFEERAHLIQADLRSHIWVDQVLVPFDAAVSVSTLHWLSAESVTQLYRRLGRLLCGGGIFLSGDNVASNHPLMQEAWKRERAELIAKEESASDSWEAFWAAYLPALGSDTKRIRQEALGDWEGVADGLPLSWHFDQLRANGFSAVDCFWRMPCYAIYGGIKG